MARFADMVHQSRQGSVVLYRAVDARGRHFHAFIRVDAAGLFKMRRDFEQRSSAPPAAYGEVLHSAYGSEPDADIYAAFRANGSI